ncbi:hypothetical protein PVAP13_3KG364800 [Panicum virgatum]|uniref:Uncharacterized protein n=1 Tax=Panicum virgatum TaxID=38727 RepID=A0A8T0UZI9_PANVG|nr:hypothetical protein PVAP13_3KG364800 [Panicum virgatum]
MERSPSHGDSSESPSPSPPPAASDPGQAGAPIPPPAAPPISHATPRPPPRTGRGRCPRPRPLDPSPFACSSRVADCAGVAARRQLGFCADDLPSDEVAVAPIPCRRAVPPSPAGAPQIETPERGP